MFLNKKEIETKNGKIQKKEIYFREERKSKWKNKKIFLEKGNLKRKLGNLKRKIYLRVKTKK